MPRLIDKVISEAKAYNRAQTNPKETDKPTLMGTAKRIGHAIVESHSQLADDVVEKVQEFRDGSDRKRKPVLALTPEEQAFAELYYHVGNSYEFRQMLTGTQSVAELAKEVELRMDFFSFSGGYEALRNYRRTTKPLMSDRMEDIMNQVDEAKALKANIKVDQQRLSELEAAFIPNKKPQTTYSSLLEASIAFAQEQLDVAMEKGDGDNIQRYHDSVTLMKSALDAYNGVTPKEPQQRERGKQRRGRTHNSYKNPNNHVRKERSTRTGNNDRRVTREELPSAFGFVPPIPEPPMSAEQFTVVDQPAVVESSITQHDLFAEPTGLDVGEFSNSTSTSELDNLPPLDLSFEDTLKPTGARERHKRRLRPIMTDDQFNQPVPSMDDAFFQSIELSEPMQQ